MKAPLRPPIALALIAALLGVVALAFAWAGGWLSPRRIGGVVIANSLQDNLGKPEPGWRRAHTKGLCVSGHFDANGAGTTLSRAALFPEGRIPVIGRFSLGGGDPMAADGRPTFHSMALLFRLAGGEQWRMAMDHTPIFPVATPADFVAFQVAGIPDPATHKPDPAKLQAYMAKHPETQAFLDYMKSAPLPSSFANGTYYSINAFRFVDAAGAAHAVRWQFEPETPFAALDKATLDAQPRDFLFVDALKRLTAGSMRWHMIIVLANPGDRTDNATIAWGPGHRRVDVGTLTLDRAATEAAGDCRDYNFDPLVLPRGVTASDDPLLPARSAAYAVSFRRRAIEGPRPDALTQAGEGGAR